MKTNENLTLKKSPNETEAKINQFNLLPAKSARPQKSMMRLKSVKPQSTVNSGKIRLKR